MRFLFAVLAEPGHLNAMIGVAQHLARGGHEVAFFSAGELSSRLAAAGLPVRCHTAPADSLGDRRATWRRDLTEALRRPGFARRGYRYYIATHVSAQIPALRDAVRASRPDVIATDPSVYAAPIVAEQERIPWAALSPQLLALAPLHFRCPHFDHVDHPELAAARANLLAAAGVEVRFLLGEAVSPWLSTVFATEELAPPDRRGDHVICVGPPCPIGQRGDEPAFPWERLRANVPLVYASFGSQLAPPAALYEALGGALGPGEADLVIAVGDPPQAAGPWPAHVTAVGWAPQLALLDRAAVMVTHGGANSVAECLARGKPLLVIPLGYEQPVQAYLLERAGAGIALAPEATADQLAAVLRALLADGPHRRRAAELGRSYATADGSRRAAELLVELGRTREPIAPRKDPSIV